MNKLIEVVKKIKPLGFTGLSLYDVSVFFKKDYKKELSQLEHLL